MRTMGAGEFKAKCLAVMDDVARTGEPVLVTKRGKPVARVVSPDEAPQHEKDVDSIFGFLRGMAVVPEGVDLVRSEFAEEEWSRMADESLNPPGRVEIP